MCTPIQTFKNHSLSRSLFLLNGWAFNGREPGLLLDTRCQQVGHVEANQAGVFLPREETSPRSELSQVEAGLRAVKSALLGDQ